MTIRVAKAMGRATSIAADSARSRRAARVEAPARRCRMFSTMMIAASTSKPTAMASPPKRHGVQADVEPVQQQAGQRDRHRNGQGHHESRSPVPQQAEDDQDDEDRPQHHGAADAAECGFDQRGLVIDDPQLDAFRQATPDVFHRLAHAGRHGHGVGAELLRDPGAHHLAGEPVGHAATHGRRLANVGHIAQQHRHVAPHRDHRVSQILGRADTADRPHRPFDGALRDHPARRVDVRFVDGVEDVVQADASSRHPFRIELHLELTEVSAQPLDGRHARHGEQAVLDVELRQIPQRHQIGAAGVRFQRELEDLVQPPGQTRDERWLGSRRELPCRLRDSLGHELPRPVVVGIRLELDRDLRHTQLRIRANAAHVGETGELDLERNGDGRLELLRPHRGVLGDDVEDGCGQVREHVSRAGPAARPRRWRHRRRPAAK